MSSTPNTPGCVLTDEQILSAAVTAADALDATRVSEMRKGGWHATTIFEGDSGLLRFGRLVEKAVLSTRSEIAALPGPLVLWLQSFIEHRVDAHSDREKLREVIQALSHS